MRRTWFPKSSEFESWEARGAAVRFVVGTSQQAMDPKYEALRREMKQFEDILEMPSMVDSYDGRTFV